jgi:hypothetical protein
MAALPSPPRSGTAAHDGTLRVSGLPPDEYVAGSGAAVLAHVGLVEDMALDVAAAGRGMPPP